MNIKAFKRHWPILADDTDPQTNDPSNMQTLVDGTAQALATRIWKGYVSNDLRQFPQFMLQLDEMVTNWVQAQPVPIDPGSLEDGVLPTDPDDLPSIGAPDDSD